MHTTCKQTKNQIKNINFNQTLNESLSQNKKLKLK